MEPRNALDARRQPTYLHRVMRTPLLACGLAVLLGCSRESNPPAPTSTSTTSTGTSAPNAPGELAVGQAAPDFSATAHDGVAIKPRALAGKHLVLVIFFYPRADTPGCTKEACAFRDAWKELEQANVVLVGLSTDSLESHKKFAENHKLPFHLVSDEDGAIAKAYGVPSTLGRLARQTIVIGPDGKVKKIYRSVDVSQHAAEIVADVKS